MCEAIEACSFHYRNNIMELDRRDPFAITYVGEYAVHSETMPDDSAEVSAELWEEVSALAVDAIMGLEGLGEKATDLLGRIPTVPATIIYKVGHGAISDSMNLDGTIPEEAIFGTHKAQPGEDLEGHHRNMVSGIELISGKL